MKRRAFLAAATLPLATPARAQPVPDSVLRYVPAAPLVELDPAGTAPETRDHALLVYDTLFAPDARGRSQPQMLDTFNNTNAGMEWRLVLRRGQSFHNLDRVFAADCVASIRRWARSDPWGQALLAATAELSAPDDRTILFRLKTLFPLLPEALGRTGPRICAIMPARIADGAGPVTDIVGSGPYSFDAAAWQTGKTAAYRRFAPYIPSRMAPSGHAGAKEAILERVEWRPIADPAEAQAALLKGGIDWWQSPPARLLAPLAADKSIRLPVPLAHGSIAALRFNHLHPPFDRPEVRRAVHAAVSQTTYMRALAGANGPAFRDDIGFFCPGTPMATGDEIAALRPPAAAVGANAAGPIVLLVNADRDADKLLAGVTADLLRGLGFFVQTVPLAAAAYLARLAETKAPADGGWHLHHVLVDGDEQADPVGHSLLRGNGKAAAPGWPSSPRIEAMVDAWLHAPEPAWQKHLCVEIQRVALEELPYIPLGQVFLPTAYRARLKHVAPGTPVFWNIEPG